MPSCLSRSMPSANRRRSNLLRPSSPKRNRRRLPLRLPRPEQRLPNHGRARRRDTPRARAFLRFRNPKSGGTVPERITPIDVSWPGGLHGSLLLIGGELHTYSLEEHTRRARSCNDEEQGEHSAALTPHRQCPVAGPIAPVSGVTLSLFDPASAKARIDSDKGSTNRDRSAMGWPGRYSRRALTRWCDAESAPSVRTANAM